MNSSRRDEATKFAPPERVPPASPRQTSIAVLLLQGLGYDEIGQKLGISGRTVEAHVIRLASRLETDDDAANLGPRERVIVWIHTHRRAA